MNHNQPAIERAADQIRETRPQRCWPGAVVKHLHPVCNHDWPVALLGAAFHLHAIARSKVPRRLHKDCGVAFLHKLQLLRTAGVDDGGSEVGWNGTAGLLVGERGHR